MAKADKELVDKKNWYKDRYQYVIVQRKILAIITVLSLISSLATVFVIAQLTPLKTIEPFVIQVDQKTGITQTVDPMTAQELSANEAVNNFFIAQYVRAREGYAIIDLARSYNMVRLMSEGGKVYTEFVNQAGPNNPNSNSARLGTSGTRTVRFKSIIYLEPNFVQLRVLIEEHFGNSIAQLNKIILLKFQYVKLALNQEERFINPLGFRITDYSVNEDTPQQ